MNQQLSKLKPLVLPFIFLIIGLVLGLVWGSFSVEIINTGLWQLEISYQGIYIQAVADAYALDGNDALALERLAFFCGQDGLDAALNSAQDRYGSDPSLLANLDQLRTLTNSGQWVQNTGVGVCNTKAIGTLANIGRLASMVLVILIVLGFIAYGVWQVMKGEEAAAPAKPGAAVTAPTRRPARRKKDEPPTLETVKSAAAKGAVLSSQAEKTDFTKASTGAPPIVQFMTTYLHGDDLFDDSFSIETDSGEFLGETGVGISETIGTGDAKNVTAFEVWLFDKNDIRTVTKVLMSDHAFNDDALKAKLAPKGEAVLAKPGDRLTLETASLRVQARIVDLSYGSGPLPPNSFFERITIELAAWKRDASSEPGPPSRAPVGAPPSAGGSRPPAAPSAPGGSRPPGAPSGPAGTTPPTGLPPAPRDD